MGDLQRSPLYTETIGQKLRHDLSSSRGYRGGGTSSWVLQPGVPFTEQNFLSDARGNGLSVHLTTTNEYDVGGIALDLCLAGRHLVVVREGTLFEQWVAQALSRHP